MVTVTYPEGVVIGLAIHEPKLYNGRTMAKIKSVTAREILDSRGNPTVEVDITLASGAFGRVSVPSGASTGSHEAVELRDGGTRYGGKSVMKAVENVNTVIQKAIKGKDFDQKKLDTKLIELDGTTNKGKLGANAILGVSMAFARAAAHDAGMTIYGYFNSITPGKRKMVLPVPMMNIINGGKHASKSADIQEFMIVPHGFKTFGRALQAGTEVFHALKKILHDTNHGTTVGDEGGFAPSLKSNEAAIELVMQAVEKAGYKPGKEISLALDVAGTELYSDGVYKLVREGKTMKSSEMVAWYKMLVEKYPIISIEDGLAEDDWDGWISLTKTLGSKIMVVGDDLFVTNIKRLQTGIERHAGNCILVKLNQIGTVSETIDSIDLATKASYNAIISHRSGETEDSTIADFSVGTGVGYIKTGSLSRTDRVAKYNQLLRIEEEMGNKAVYGMQKK